MPDGTTGQAGEAEATAAATAAGEGLGEAGKAALDAERKARREAERELRDLRAKAEQAETAEAAAKQRREQDAAAARGEFDRVRAELERDRDAATAELATLRAEHAAMREAVAGVIAAEWSALPEEVRDAYLGGEDDPLAQLAFLPKGKVLAARLAERAGAARGNGPDPRANGAARGGNDEAARKAFAEMSRRNF